MKTKDTATSQAGAALGRLSVKANLLRDPNYYKKCGQRIKDVLIAKHGSIEAYREHMRSVRNSPRKP